MLEAHGKLVLIVGTIAIVLLLVVLLMQSQAPDAPVAPSGTQV